MYQPNRARRSTHQSYGSARPRPTGGFRGRGSYGGGGRRTPRALDPTMFVKKASAEVVAQDAHQATVQFSEYALDERIKQNIIAHGYTHPTAIQEQAIPHILAGRDVIGIANTGTGKTAAFLVSLINKCLADNTQRVLIVVPTRELAIQIKDEYMIFARGLNMGVVATVGGTDIWRQIQGLRRKPQFVIGTPGRLRDLIERRELDLSHFHNVVLDEVDRMVDMGFIQDIKYLLGLLPKDRHSLFFTATIDARTQEILNGFVAEDPVKVSVKQQSTNENIEQDVVRVPHGTAKLDVLMELLKRPGFDKVLIFGRTKRGVENLSHLLYTNGFQTVAIHGNKSQHQRNRALQAFKDNKVNIMIATDVAARGLDIDSVTHVINYEAPTSYDDYVHRIGRTGRAGKRGFALTFID